VIFFGWGVRDGVYGYDYELFFKILKNFILDFEDLYIFDKFIKDVKT
jgi:hypothetical protein